METDSYLTTWCERILETFSGKCASHYKTKTILSTSKNITRLGMGTIHLYCQTFGPGKVCAQGDYFRYPYHQATRHIPACKSGLHTPSPIGIYRAIVFGHILTLGTLRTSLYRHAAIFLLLSLGSFIFTSVPSRNLDLECLAFRLLRW
jgi:hypothetical protein